MICLYIGVPKFCTFRFWGKRETNPWDAPGTGHGLSGVDTQEPCGASPFFSNRVGGEKLARMTYARIYQNLRITDFSPFFVSTFCSIQMISLLFLQLILEAITNGSKRYRVFKLVFSFCVSHLTQRGVHWGVHSPDPVARVAMLSCPSLVARLGSAEDSPPLMLGAGWSRAQTSWGGSHSHLPSHLPAGLLFHSLLPILSGEWLMHILPTYFRCSQAG